MFSPQRLSCCLLLEVTVLVGFTVCVCVCSHALLIVNERDRLNRRLRIYEQTGRLLQAAVMAKGSVFWTTMRHGELLTMI